MKWIRHANETGSKLVYCHRSPQLIHLAARAYESRLVRFALWRCALTSPSLAGLYPGDPDDLPIDKPLEMFNVAGADFLDPKLVERDKEEQKLRRSKSQAKVTGL